MSPKIINPTSTTYRISEKIFDEIQKFADGRTILPNNRYSFQTSDYITGGELRIVITRLLSQTTEDIQKSDEGRSYVNAFGIKLFPRIWLVRDTNSITTPIVDFSECGDYFFYRWQDSGDKDEIPIIISNVFMIFMSFFIDNKTNESVIIVF